MPVPSQGHYGFHSFPVVDWFCLFIYLWVLIFPLEDCSEFGNFVITLIYLSNIFRKISTPGWKVFCNLIAYRPRKMLLYHNTHSVIVVTSDILPQHTLSYCCDFWHFTTTHTQLLLWLLTFYHNTYSVIVVTSDILPQHTLSYCCDFWQFTHTLHLNDATFHYEEKVWAHKTIWTSPLFIDVHETSKEIER